MKIVNFAPPSVSTGHARRLYGKRLSKIVGLRQILFAGLESFLDRLEPFSTLRKPNAALEWQARSLSWRSRELMAAYPLEGLVRHIYAMIVSLSHSFMFVIHLSSPISLLASIKSTTAFIELSQSLP